MSSEIEKVVAKWRKEIADYDAAHINSSDPEDWMAGHRQCLKELEAALSQRPAVDEAMVERAAWRILPKMGDTREIEIAHAKGDGRWQQAMDTARNALTASDASGGELAARLDRAAGVRSDGEAKLMLDAAEMIRTLSRALAESRAEVKRWSGDAHQAQDFMRLIRDESDKNLARAEAAERALAESRGKLEAAVQAAFYEGALCGNTTGSPDEEWLSSEARAAFVADREEV